jgi:ferredoxin-NADP reductase
MKLTLTAKHALEGNAWRFIFTPGEPLTWLAGQFIRVGLPHPRPDAKGTTRWFTIAAAPHEGLVSICTRLTGSTFKQALASLPLGGQLDMVEAPAGDFIWRPADRPHIFAAQGIGITPFYAIIKDRLYHGLPVAASLIYAHQTDTPVLFAREFDEWLQADPTLQLRIVTGTITPAAIIEYEPDYAGRHLYVSGPKSFISLCMPPHNLPINQLKQDNFPGYAVAGY